jgi:two-component system KDP operon response regulator KdpE
MPDGGLRVLVVDDEPSIRRFLSVSLTAHGHTIVEASRGEEALAKVMSQRLDLIILDLGLPDLDGVEVTRRLREWTAIPILILSVRSGEADKVAALDAGADDYLTKPFGIEELLARIRTAMRHVTPIAAEPVFTTGELTLDQVRRVVLTAGHEVQLTPTEYDLLRVLVMHAGKVLTHRHLVRELWGPNAPDDLHALRVNISNLRRKIEPDPARPRYVVTEPGVGYRLRLAN